jgi:hypothetical protein
MRRQNLENHGINSRRVKVQLGNWVVIVVKKYAMCEANEHCALASISSLVKEVG